MVGITTGGEAMTDQDRIKSLETWLKRANDRLKMATSEGLLEGCVYPTVKLVGRIDQVLEGVRE